MGNKVRLAVRELWPVGKHGYDKQITIFVRTSKEGLYSQKISEGMIKRYQKDIKGYQNIKSAVRHPSGFS